MNVNVILDLLAPTAKVSASYYYIHPLNVIFLIFYSTIVDHAH